MPENVFMKKHRNDGVPLQVLSDVGLNPFAVELLVESYTNRPEDKMIPVDFIFRGVRIRLEKAAQTQKG